MSTRSDCKYGKDYIVKFYDADKNTRLLNPENVLNVWHSGKTFKPLKLSIPVRPIHEIISL